MGWVKEALAELKQGRSVQIQPFGGSMRGRIESGQLVTLQPVEVSLIKPNDVVLVRWQKNYLLHLVVEATPDQLLIGNNLGKTNGWVSRSDVAGIVVHVEEEPILDATAVSWVQRLDFRVRLDDGMEVTARVSKETARRMISIPPGSRVRLAGPCNHKYRIVGFANPMRI